MKGYATITALVCLFTIFSIIPGYIAWGDVWWYVRHTSLFREPTQQGSSIAGDIASPSLAVVEPVRSFMTAFYWGTQCVRQSVRPRPSLWTDGRAKSEAVDGRTGSNSVGRPSDGVHRGYS